jgi:hypothetical protein
VFTGATVAAIAALIALYLGARASRALEFAGESAGEFAALETKYGPQHYSRFGEEWIIRDVFGDKRNGVFVDVGANDYRRDSNTNFLETVLNWSGVAIDAQREYAVGYQQNRLRTRFFAAFVSDTTVHRSISTFRSIGD